MTLRSKNTIDAWQRANEAYLAEKLAWLRKRLGGEKNGAASSRLNRTAARKKQAAADASAAALEILASRLGLSPFERDVLLLCAAMELDTRIAGLCAKAQGDQGRPFPTFALAMTVLDDPAWDALSPHRPLRRLRLIEVNQGGATPLTAAALRADERIVNFVKGLNYFDDRLTPLMSPLEPGDCDSLAASQQAVVDSLGHELRADAHGQLPPVVELIGPDRASKQSVAACVTAQFGLALYRLPAELIPNDFGEFEMLLRLWDRERRLLPLALYIDAAECDASSLASASSPINRLLARVEGLALVDLDQQRSIPGRRTLIAEVAKPTPLEQRALWTELTCDATASAQLSGQFSLSVSDMRRLAEKTGGAFDAIWAACRRETRPQLDSLAQRIDAKATWDDLVLAAEPLGQLHEIASQVRHRSTVYDDWGFRERCNRGLGISVLFAGESGTGKTMAAEVIANDLKLDLYRIDLSAVVNKYIGETEKNLKRLFDAADDGGAILLFDEADALFGKRSEVKDSHDRYANLEVNYLLQRMESYRGLAILATNLKGSLDKAFMRRLRFVVDFPLPDLAMRREIWRKAWPSAAPLGCLDFDALARLNVTGGNIHSIALNAAFSVAAEPKGDSVAATNAVAAAAQHEFRKLQKPLVFRPLRQGA